MSTPRLLALPVELLGYVVDQLPWSDYASLSLVCKELHSVVVPKLYRNISLPIHRLDDQLRLSLNPANDNLKVRSHGQTGSQRSCQSL
jgi:hypothetical protein